MQVEGSIIRCPKCGWEPEDNSRWVCDECDTRWNTFETHGRCPGCGKVFVDTGCSKRQGGCGQMSLNSEWYLSIEIYSLKENKKKNWFWLRKKESPITMADREWIEERLLWLRDLFTPEVFRSLETIKPDKEFFDYNFTGKEGDADFILKKLASIMNIKPWEIQLMFFSTKSTEFSEGVRETPSEKLNESWSSKSSELIDKGFGNKEIWIPLDQMNDPTALIATISVELAKYKLTTDYMIEEHLNVFSEITSIVFGFGIFFANSYFKFGQWQGNTHHGWQMQKRGGLPEPIIAYTMAWLSVYRNEDVSCKHHLNRTVKKYFEESYKYIKENPAEVRFK